MNLALVDNDTAKIADEGTRQTQVLARDADRLRTGETVNNPKTDITVAAPAFDPP